MQILRASEDYLEAMLMMQQEHGYIRSIDIADKLGVTKPSVTYATKRLRENGYITMDKDGARHQPDQLRGYLPPRPQPPLSRTRKESHCTAGAMALF